MATSFPQSASIIGQWSADAITPQADNSNLAAWTDSVSGIVFAQASSGLQPKYRTNRLDGKPSVQFPGTAVLTAGRPAAMLAANAAQICTVFVVFRNLGASGFGALFSWGHNDNGGMLYADGANVGSFYDNTAGIIPMPTQGSFSTIGESTNKGYTGGSGGGVDRVYINGGSVTQRSSLAAVMGAAGEFCIGNDHSSGGVAVNAEIFDIVYLSVPLTPAEMMQAQAWACEKYAQPYPWASSPHITVYHGDSLAVGIGIASHDASDTAPFQSAQALGLPFGTWHNLGVGGAAMAEMMATGAPGGIDGFADIVAFTGKPLKVAAFEWWNQRAASPGPKNATLAYLAALRSSTVKIAIGTSTGSGEDPDTNRNTYNAEIAAAVASADAYMPIHLDAQIGTPEAYAAHPENWSDIVHLNEAGYPHLAPILTAGINAITFSVPIGSLSRNANQGV